jgi:4-aminobutyrate aminotransferase/(S)-3-amino-2-methylpropionate transaminase
MAVLDVFDTEELVARARAIGDQIRGALLRLQARVPRIGDVRGMGAMLAIELVKDPATKEPDADFAQQVIDRARDLGLLLLKCGSHKNVVRLLPPLTASSDEIGRGLAMLEAAVGAAG